MHSCKKELNRTDFVSLLTPDNNQLCNVIIILSKLEIGKGCWRLSRPPKQLSVKWVLADQVGISHHFQQGWYYIYMCTCITKVTFCIFVARMAIFEEDLIYLQQQQQQLIFNNSVSYRPLGNMVAPCSSGRTAHKNQTSPQCILLNGHHK